MFDILLSLYLTSSSLPFEEAASFGNFEDKVSVSPIPSLENHIAFSLDAEAYLAVDVDTNVLLLEKNAQEELPMASLTKLMTALLILENHDGDEVVKISRNAVRVEGSKIWLKQGEEMTIENLLKGLLVKSGNDTAIALAEYHSGSVENFVAEMNQRAKSLRMNHTSFQNPHGLDQEDHYSSAHDLLLLVQALWNFNFFRETVAQKSIRILSLTQPERSFANTNKLLSDEIKGIKTGTTDEAKECLVLYIEKGRRKIFTVVLGSHQRYNDSKIFLEALWKSVHW